MRQGSLAGRYPAAAAMVIFALVPYLGLSAALQPLTPIIGRQLHMSAQTMSLGLGMANAGYAVGTVLAVQFAQLLPQRRMMVLYAVLLVIGSVLAAAAANPAMFIAGHVLQGLCTSLLLIAAVPPLALGFGLEKFRWTAMIMNVCIFGAVALGPVAGGIQASAHAWRPLFWIVAAISLAALLLSLLTFEDAPPADRDAPRAPLAIGLAAAGCVAAFYGASELLTHRFLGAQTFLPLVGGLALIVVLVVNQFRSRRPLLTVRTMLTSTVPVAGIIAVALGVVLNKRQLHYLPLAGMAFLAAGIAVFRIQVPPTEALTLIGSGLTGIGLGAAVAPALFVAGFSLRAASLQRVFAIVELFRAVAAFMIAPVFVHFAATVGGNAKTGTGIALWIGFGLAAGGAVIAVLLYALGRARPQTPNLERFMDGEGPAWYSPPLLAGIRNRSRHRALAEDPARP
jgi:MFS family permease